jgi:hypothetical protein
VRYYITPSIIVFGNANMKKLLLLLFSVFLLFPIVIYFGNLADIPAAKKVVVCLRDLAGMSTSKEITEKTKAEIIKVPAPYNHIGLVESWRNLGASNFADLLQIVAAQGKQEAWQTSAGDFLNDALYSSAFFSPAWSFWQARQEKLSLVGYYQPWLDVLLLMQIAEVDGSYKAVAIGITEPSMSLTANTPATMAQELTTHLQRAEQLFQTASQNPDTIDGMLNTTVVEKAKTRLIQYTTDLRNKLATNSEKPILTWLDDVRSGKIQINRISNDWLKQLQPVQLIKINEDNWLLAASVPKQSEQILLVRLHISNHQAQSMEIKIWDAANAGGVQ